MFSSRVHGLASSSAIGVVYRIVLCLCVGLLSNNMYLVSFHANRLRIMWSI